MREAQDIVARIVADAERIKTTAVSAILAVTAVAVPTARAPDRKRGDLIVGIRAAFSRRPLRRLKG